MAQSVETVATALHVIGDFLLVDEQICSGLVSKAEGQSVHDNVLLRSLQNVLDMGGTWLKQKALWIISNIIVNSEADALYVLDNGIFAQVATFLLDKHIKLQEEALWALSNMLSVL